MNFALESCTMHVFLFTNQQVRQTILAVPAVVSSASMEPEAGAAVNHHLLL